MNLKVILQPEQTAIRGENTFASEDNRGLELLLVSYGSQDTRVLSINFLSFLLPMQLVSLPLLLRR